MSNRESINTSEWIGSGLISLNIVETISEWKDYHLKIIGVYSHTS